MHFLVGIATIALMFYLGRHFMVAAIFFIILAGMLVINLRLNGMKLGIVEWFVKRFERKDVLFPGFGAATFATGTLIPMVFLADTSQVAACIFILAVGDGVSTLVGRAGRIKLPYNKEKTIEGTAAFLVASAPAYYFVGPAIIPVAIISALVESIDFGVDDNLMVPIVCTLFFLIA